MTNEDRTDTDALLTEIVTADPRSILRDGSVLEQMVEDGRPSKPKGGDHSPSSQPQGSQ